MNPNGEKATCLVTHGEGRPAPPGTRVARYKKQFQPSLYHPCLTRRFLGAILNEAIKNTTEELVYFAFLQHGTCLNVNKGPILS